MGELGRLSVPDEQQLRTFTHALLADLHALETMLDRGMLSTDEPQIGVEQEMFLIDAQGCAAPVAHDVLDSANDPRLTTELAQFNLEVNLPPRPFRGSFLSSVHRELDEALHVVRVAAGPDAHVLLAGILPSLEPSDLSLDNMTREERYVALNEAILRSRGDRFSIFIAGLDQLETRQSSVMLEAANTSFQLHLQVNPDDFASAYNLAQLISGPMLAAAVNSPVLLGRRLWRETRVALFERATDVRTAAEQARDRLPRVTFGSGWLKESVLEIFRESAARFRALLTRENIEDAALALEEGRVPRLSALTLHNGTVWRWNRACYGYSEEGAHLRIENRVLPAGPSTLDEVANAALFFGLMRAMREEARQIPSRISFDEAKGNFMAAARSGLEAGFDWLDGRKKSARRLLLDDLIPRAREGLAEVGVPSSEIAEYLGVLEDRVRSGQTGSSWLLRSIAEMAPDLPREARLLQATRGMREHQRSGEPVHRWPVGGVWPDAPDQASHSDFPTVGRIMSTDLFTVRPEDVVDLAHRVMDWQRIRHIPVEDEHGSPVGLLTHEQMLGHTRGPVAVSELMTTDIVLVPPDMDVVDAMKLLLETPTACLLVVSEGKLVGLVTDRDLVRVSAGLLDAE